ncbi:MAG: hypothetical protein JWR69_4725 [Pedosphaera sp.]|nr:hypothetical protein [Pedosphaera sp.]
MTDTNKSDVQPLKTDARGRVRTPAKRRESLLEEFDRSGLSGAKFAELAGIKYQTFATWLQQRRRQGQPASKPGDTVRWLEAVVEQAQSSVGPKASSVRLHLPGGAHIELADVKQMPLAAALLHSLEKPC